MFVKVSSAQLLAAASEAQLHDAVDVVFTSVDNVRGVVHVAYEDTHGNTRTHLIGEGGMVAPEGSGR